MVRRKEIRKRGKISLSQLFQRLNEGDNVAVVRERSIDMNFPERLQGRTGVVVGKRGRFYVVKIKDLNRTKEYIIEAIHLKKIKQENKK